MEIDAAQPEVARHVRARRLELHRKHLHGARTRAARGERGLDGFKVLKVGPRPPQPEAGHVAHVLHLGGARRGEVDDARVAQVPLDLHDGLADGLVVGGTLPGNDPTAQSAWTRRHS